MFGIYVHFPYCRAVCPYCNFNSHVVASIPHARYADAILAELRTRTGLGGLAGRQTQSLYFGGGTPGLWRSSEVARIIDGVAGAYHLEGGAEITAEVNPGSLDEDALPGLRAAGVNRLSIGIQSLHDHHLHRLGRLHTAAEALRTLDKARAAGFDDISIDFMFGLPGQTLAAWEDDLERIGAIGASHISAYTLTVEEETPLASWVKRGQVKLPGEDIETDQLLATRARLRVAGYEHYEVSNYARPGRRAKHNSLYWLGGEWLGLGAGAHGFLRTPADRLASRDLRDSIEAAGVRWADVDDPSEYMSRALAGELPESMREPRGRGDLVLEEIMSGLRWLDGLDLDAFAARTGTDLRVRFAGVLEGLAKDGLANLDESRRLLRLEEQGFLFLNAVALRFYESSGASSTAKDRPRRPLRLLDKSGSGGLI